MGGKLAKPKIDNAGPTSAHSFTTSPVETVGPKSHTAFGRTPLRHAKLPLPNDLRVPAVLSISEGHASNPSASSPAPLKPSPVFRSFLQQVHRAFARVNTGEVASYIPELKKANPDDFGICVVTMDGVVYEVGDSDVPFTIQSASKPFAYCLALEDNSLETVLSKVGVEPTGQAFNVLSVDSKGRPRNPLINAGAIATSSLVKGATPAAQFEGIRRRFSDFAGHPLPLDTAVFRSEHATGHRNRGFGHMLKQAGVIEGDVDAACDIYFKQCSIQVTARDLAIMAATLANGGVNPISGRRVASSGVVHRVLGVMSTCGMYDSSGEWLFDVGMPAKSGVGGGVMAILPGQVAIATFSPRLNAVGHSVRGVGAISQIANAFKLHFLAVARASRSVIRAQVTLRVARSRRHRSEAEANVLTRDGDAARVIFLQGDVSFAAIERVLRDTTETEEGDIVVFDLKHVSRINYAAFGLLLTLSTRAHVVLAHVGPFKPSVQLWKDNAAHGTLPSFLTGDASRVFTFAGLDEALEWAEDQLLSSAHVPVIQALPPASHPFLSLLSPAEVEAVVARSHVQSYQPSEALFQVGDASDTLFLLLSGSVYLSMPSPAALRMRATPRSPRRVAHPSSPLPPHVPSKVITLKRTRSHGTDGDETKSGPESPPMNRRMIGVLSRLRPKVRKLKAKRLAIMGAGAAVGDDALVASGPRKVDAVAHHEGTTCLVVKRSIVDDLSASVFPGLRGKLVERMALQSAALVERLSSELSMLTT